MQASTSFIFLIKNHRGKKHDWLITPNFNEFPFQFLSKNASFWRFFLCAFSQLLELRRSFPSDGCWAGAERPQQSSQQREDCGADLVTFEWYLLGQRPHRGWSFFFLNWIPDRRIQDGNDGVGGSLFFFVNMGKQSEVFLEQHKYLIRHMWTRPSDTSSNERRDSPLP